MLLLRVGGARVTSPPANPVLVTIILLEWHHYLSVKPTNGHMHLVVWHTLQLSLVPKNKSLSHSLSYPFLHMLSNVLFIWNQYLLRWTKQSRRLKSMSILDGPTAKINMSILDGYLFLPCKGSISDTNQRFKEYRPRDENASKHRSRWHRSIWESQKRSV